MHLPYMYMCDGLSLVLPVTIILKSRLTQRKSHNSYGHLKRIFLLGFLIMGNDHQIHSWAVMSEQWTKMSRGFKYSGYVAALQGYVDLNTCLYKHSEGLNKPKNEMPDLG